MFSVFLRVRLDTSIQSRPCSHIPTDRPVENSGSNSSDAVVGMECGCIGPFGLTCDSCEIRPGLVQCTVVQSAATPPMMRMGRRYANQETRGLTPHCFPLSQPSEHGTAWTGGVLLSFSAGSRGGPPGRGPLSANESRPSHPCSDNKRRFLQQKIRVLGPTLWLSLSKVDDCPIRRLKAPHQPHMAGRCATWRTDPRE